MRSGQLILLLQAFTGELADLGLDLLVGCPRPNNIDDRIHRRRVAVPNRGEQLFQKPTVIFEFLVGSPGRNLASFVGKFVDDTLPSV